MALPSLSLSLSCLLQATRPVVASSVLLSSSSSSSASTEPSLTMLPSEQCTSCTTPWRGDTTTCSIFMASRMRSGWPSFTWSPGFTATRSTFPGIGARTCLSPAPAPRALLDTSRAGSVKEYIWRSHPSGGAASVSPLTAHSWTVCPPPPLLLPTNVSTEKRRSCMPGPSSWFWSGSKSTAMRPGTALSTSPARSLNTTSAAAPAPATADPTVTSRTPLLCSTTVTPPPSFAAFSPPSALLSTRERVED
mmetsp:Transcript_82133/g.164127  ORF Transcript_82133/g.164127 Transcript_82133/m.164127 type:complete len:249 (+) Transcript_82133:307-1053(+)